MMKAKTPYTALFVATLLLACDAGPPGAGDLSKEGRAADDRGSEDALPDEGESAPTRSDEESEPEPSVATIADQASASAPVALPAAATHDAEPAPTATENEAERWFVKGTTSPAFAAGNAQKTALQAGAELRLSLLSDAGTLEVVARGKVDLDGTFSLALPLDVSVDLGIAELLDVSGHVVGSVILGGGKGKPGQVLKLAPINAETSLEVAVLLAATNCPCAPDKKPSALSLALDVSALIDANLSNTLSLALQLGADLDVVTHGLADALMASARARAEVIVDLGVKVDASLMVNAQLDALSQLRDGLIKVSAGQAKLLDVSAQLALSLDGALSLSAKLDADLRLRAQVAANLAFATSLSKSFSVDAKLNASLFAARHAALALEAELTANAVVELLQKAGAGAANIQVAIDAGLKLKADVAVALDLDAIVTARNKFIDAVCGKTSAGGGLLGGVLAGTTGLAFGLLDGLLGSVLDLSLNLDTKLTLDLAAVTDVDVCASVDASLKLGVSLSALADTLAKFDADVHAGVNGSANAKVAAKVLVSAQLFGRVAI